MHKLEISIGDKILVVYPIDEDRKIEIELNVESIWLSVEQTKKSHRST
jgi:hypothetical protein